MELVQILFHIGYGVRCVASVLCHHIEVNERPDASERTFERYCLRPSWLAKSHGENSQNTTPQIPYLFPLPLRNLAVGFFGNYESWVWRESLPNLIKCLQSPVFLQKGFDPVHHMLK